MTADLGRENGARDLTLAQVMLPGDANQHGNVHGGTLMKLADSAGGICASRFVRCPVVTVVMDSMTFEQPAYVGDVVLLHARVTWTGRTSIEAEVTIRAENVVRGEVRHISSAYFVYVAIDDEGRPAPITRPLVPRTPEEQRTWEQAEKRRAHRLERSQRATAPP